MDLSCVKIDLADATEGHHEGMTHPASELATGKESNDETSQELAHVGSSVGIEVSQPHDIQMDVISLPSGDGVETCHARCADHMGPSTTETTCLEEAIPEKELNLAKDASTDRTVLAKAASDLPPKQEPLRPGRHGTLSLLTMCLDVRLEIYDLFSIPINETITLTYGPASPVWLRSDPARHYLSKDVVNLLVSCRQVNDELTDLVYGRNDFALIPGGQNYNCPRMSDPMSTSRLWLSHMSLNTRLTVRKLQVYLDLSLPIETVVAGLKDFPRAVCVL